MSCHLWGGSFVCEIEKFENPSGIKHHNNGTKTCSEYCKSDKWGIKYDSCVKAIDTSTQNVFGCDIKRGYGAKEVTCFCKNEPKEPIYLKNGNDGTVSCKAYCRNENPFGPDPWGIYYEKCYSGLDLSKPNGEHDIGCDVVRGRRDNDGIRVGCLCQK